MNDLVIVREKRGASNPGLELPDTYPTDASIKAKINAHWDNFIINKSPIYAFKSSKYTANFVAEISGSNYTTKLFSLFTDNIYKSDLKKVITYKSAKFNGVTFELSDMLGKGTLTITGHKGLTKEMTFSVEFSPECVIALKLAQARYSGKFDKTIHKITLRDKAPTDWVDLRTTKPYYWKVPLDSADPWSTFKIFEKDITSDSKRSDYLDDDAPFYGNTKITLPSAPSGQSYKLHP